MSELCGVCGAALRDQARFCGRCGAEHGVMVARDAGAGPVQPPRGLAEIATMRGLTVALIVYFASLVPTLIVLARRQAPTLATLDLIEVAIGLAGLIGVAVLGRAAWRGFGWPRLTARGAALALVATAGVFGLIELVAALAPSLFLDLDPLMRAYGLGLAGTLLHTALLPALLEEIAFRGAILSGLRGVLGDRPAIATSALMFAILHVSLVSVVHLALLGAILGAVRLRSGSVWPCVALHALYNAAVVIAAW